VLNTIISGARASVSKRSLNREATRPSRLGALLIVAMLPLLLTAYSSGMATLPASRSRIQVKRGGIASYALPAGEEFSWILPIENLVNAETWDVNVEDGSWRPLAYAGNDGKTGIDYTLSVMRPPVYTDHDTVVTVNINRNYRWSDGQPVTSADVKFFFELQAAAAKEGKYGHYVPGEMPDDIKSVETDGPFRLIIKLTHSYDPLWFTGSQLTQAYALPAQVWDKTCATCSVGDHASTLGGAEAVFNYLYSQSSDLSTYGSNPLWKVVDGPWVISSYDPTTFHAVLKANSKYSGPQKPHLAGYSIYSFSSDTAEVDAVRAGIVDFGFLPYTDLAAAPYYEAHGFTVKAWKVFSNEVIEFGYTGPSAALVKQLYIRQALQHVVDESLYIKTTLHGYGIPDYGIAPDFSDSDLVSPYLRHDPYPFSVRAARRLLAVHGWMRGANGIDVCRRPGSKASECGLGIAKGRSLSLLFMYQTGDQSFLAQVEAFATAAKSAGIGIVLDGKSETTMYTIAAVCPPGPCDWGLAGYYPYMWPFGQFQLAPIGGTQFGKGNFWAGGYDSVTAQRLIDHARTESGLKYLYQDEDYLSKNMASLWWPLPDYEILLVKDTLKGWSHLNPYGNYEPSTWYYNGL